MKKLASYINESSSQVLNVGSKVVISVNEEYVIESSIEKIDESVTITLDAVTLEVLKHAKANPLNEAGKVVDFDRIGRYSKWGQALLQVLKWSSNPKVMSKMTTENDIVLVIQDHILNQILEKEAPGITSNHIAMYAKAIPELDYQWAPKSKQHVITMPKDLKLAKLARPEQTKESELTFENNAWYLKVWTSKPINKIVAEVKQEIKQVIAETKVGKMPLNYWEANPGSVYTADKYYDMYRASMLMGRLSDKKVNDEFGDIDAYSWINNAPMLVTYTPEEYEMAKRAFAFMGVPMKAHVPLGSEEPSAVNKTSPFKPFKGYKGAERRSK